MSIRGAVHMKTVVTIIQNRQGVDNRVLVY